MQTIKKSKAMAIASFAFGLTFWIPLLNLIFGVFAIYFGYRAMHNIKSEPDKYTGKVFAITGLALGLLVYVFYFTGVSICLAGYKEVCKNIGLIFLSKN
jgi:uncharacterized membrane protein